MRQKGGSRGAALFLLLLAALSAAEPLLRSAALPAPSGLPATAGAAPTSEVDFVNRLLQWIRDYNEYLRETLKELAEKLNKLLPEGIGIKVLVESTEGPRQGYPVVNLLAKNPDDLAKAEGTIEKLYQTGFLGDTDYAQAMSSIGTDTRWYDFIIDEAVVMGFDEQQMVRIAGAAVEAKAATTNKGEFVAELIRDMYNVFKGARYSGQKRSPRSSSCTPRTPRCRNGS
jgi:hypothetical protein